MSYRSVKRVLGETSLERKCRFLFGACLLLLITGSFWWYGNQTEALVYEQNPVRGRLLVDTLMTRIHWKAEESKDPLGWMVDFLSSDLQREGSNLQEGDSGYRFIGTHNVGKVKEPEDDFERELLKRFKEPPPEPQPGEEPVKEYASRLSADGTKYYYYQPKRQNESCMISCHNPGNPAVAAIDPSSAGVSVGYKGINYGRPPRVGDLIAIARIDMDNGPTLTDLNQNRAVLISTAIITVFLAMVASYVIVRYVIVKPLKHLRDVSDSVSRGDVDKRADIHTADEFEELGVAFNRMLRHLVDTQQELRNVNHDLDGKVDELAQLTMRLFEMNRLKSDFLATMSHELRTPLNSIIGFSDVLGSIDALDEKQKRYVQNIQKSGRTLLEMINDILDLAKIESGKMEVRPSDFRIEHVVHSQCDMARPLSERKNLDLRVDVTEGLPPMHQDQPKVQQILNNLLSNAIKFTPEGGRIHVRAGRDEQGLFELVVEDTGVGIAEEDQTVIFEKFRQGQLALAGEDAMTREFSGTGLGLSIVKELCRLLGGEITLVSDLGKGSAFTVRLPWYVDDESLRAPTTVESALENLARLHREDLAPTESVTAPSHSL